VNVTRAKINDPVAESKKATRFRERILRAAFNAFIENGYAATSTLEIATRAKVSKRELYSLFGSKQAMLVACIAGRAARMRPPADLSLPRGRQELASTLTAFGTRLLTEVSHATVVAMFRLAIAEAERSPEIAHALNELGRAPPRSALARLLSNAQSAGLLGSGDPVSMARQYIALLWEDTLVTLLLRVTDSPPEDEIKRRATQATATFLQLHQASLKQRRR
jgi:AcrR family transcriptional regulator